MINEQFTRHWSNGAEDLCHYDPNGVIDWERGVDTTTPKAASISMKPTRVVKNLFDKSITANLLAGYVNNVTAGKSTTFEPWAGGDKSILMPVKPSTTYTIKRKTGISSVYDRIRVAGSSSGDTSNLKMLINIVNSTQESATFTTLADTTAIVFNCRNSGAVGDDWQQYLDALMLVEGSTAPAPYYPHFSTTTVLPSLKAYGATPVKHKQDKLWGRFVPCEYIESHGTEYIDTGVPQVKDIGIDIDFALTTTTQGSFIGLVAGTTTPTAYCVYFGLHTTYGFYSQVGGDSEYSYIGVNLDTARHKAKYRFANDTATASVDSATVSYSLTVALQSGNILIGSRANATVCSKARYYSAQIGSVRDLIPVKDVVNNVYGMWDRVTETFYGNAGTGAFTGGDLIQPVSYAESDGTAYADTGIKITSDDEVYIDGCVTASGSAFLMSQGLSADDQAYQLANTTNYGLVFDIQNYNPYRVTTDVSVLYTIRKIHIKNREIFVDGVSKGTSTGTLTNPTETAKLMYSVSGSSAQKAKVAKFTVVGKCDYIPVRIGTTVELLDLVNWQFAQRTGTFTAGADIPLTQLVPDIIKVNTGDLKYGYADLDVNIPGEYERVEYIESHGTEHIVSNVSGEVRAVGKTQLTSSDYSYGSEVILGTGIANGRYFGGVTTGNQLGLGGNGGNYITPRTILCEFDLTFAQSGIRGKLNSTSVARNISGSPAFGDLEIFKGANAENYRARAKLWGLKLYQGTDFTILVRDFVPVKKKSNNEYGMYDLITKQFFGNSGTGAFTGGTVIPRSIHTDGSHKLHIEDKNGNVISRDIPTLYSADSFIDTQLDSNNKSEARAAIWYDGTQTVPSGYISEYGDLRENQIVLYPLATPAVSTHAITHVSLTEKATYTAMSVAELPVTQQAVYMGLGI